MTDRERYKRAFDLIGPSENMDIMEYVEEKEMKERKPNRFFRKVGAVLAALAVTVGLGAVAYASDLGGIRKPVSIWLHGEMTEAVIEQVGDGAFEVTYPDGHKRSTGGMVEDGGKMRGATMDEIIEQLLTEVDLEYDENGNYWIYIRDHKIDISDQIAEKGYAQVKVKDGVLADYITVVPDGNGGVGLSCGHFGYPSVESVRRSTGTF